MWTVLWPVAVTLNIQVRGSKVSEQKNQNWGGGFLGLLTLLFIGLKLTGQIAWSWWWVLSPFWVPFAFVVVLLIIVGIGYLVKESIK